MGWELFELSAKIVKCVKEAKTLPTTHLKSVKRPPTLVASEERRHFSGFFSFYYVKKLNSAHFRCTINVILTEFRFILTKLMLNPVY